jgi:hypothetical protein
VKLFVTFLGTVSHLKWLGGLFSLAMCVLALKIFHPATLMVGMLTFDGWILLLLYHYIPLDPGWNSLFLCDFVHETFLWSRYLECSPISAVQHTEWRHTFFNWLWFCFTLNARAVFQETRGKLILTGTQFCRRSLKCLGPGNSWSTVGTGAHRCASCLPVNGLHIAKNRSFQILHLQGVSKIQNWHAPAISRGLTRSHDSATNFSKSIAKL